MHLLDRLRMLALMGLGLATPVLAQDDVPFVTTPDRVTSTMLELAQVGRGDHVIDLGSGDGRIVITAARRFGATGLGVELVPSLVEQSRAHARAAGVQDRVEFRAQDLFDTDLRQATVVTMYLLPEVNLQLRPRLLALAAGSRVVSHDYDLGDWLPDRTVEIDVPEKEVGSARFSRVHLWIVPASLHGLWCSAALSLDLRQRFQHASGTLQGAQRAPRGLVFDGRIEGSVLKPLDTHPPTLRLAAGGALHVEQPGNLPELAGTVFTRAAGGRCVD